MDNKLLLLVHIRFDIASINHNLSPVFCAIIAVVTIIVNRMALTDLKNPQPSLLFTVLG